MKILIYDKSNLKVNGSFKKNFSFKYNYLSQEDFFKYLKENNLNIKSNYIDITGLISNNKIFRCYIDEGLIIGVSGLVKEFEVLK